MYIKLSHLYMLRSMKRMDNICQLQTFFFSLPREKTGWGRKRGNRELQGQRHFLIQRNMKERLAIIIVINYFYYSRAAKGTIKGQCSPFCPLLHTPTPFFPPPPLFFYFFFLFLIWLKLSSFLAELRRFNPLPVVA